MKFSMFAHRSGGRSPRRTAARVGVLLSALVTLGACGSSGATEPAPHVDPKFASLSPAARSLLAGVVDGKTGYRVKATIGMSMASNGATFGIEPNLDQPMLVQETDAQGERHTIVDASTLTRSLGALGGGGAEQGIPTPRAEAWNDDALLVAELTGMPDTAGDSIESTDPAQQLLAPGRFKVDLTRVGSEEGSAAGDRLLAVMGQSVIDPADLMVQLGETLDRATPVPGELNKQQVTTTLGELAASSGTDPLDNPMLDEALGTDEQARADATEMIEAVSDVPVTMTFSTDTKGRLTELTTDIELSSVAQAMGGLDASADPAAQDAVAVAENMELSMSYPLAIEYDDAIDVVVPTDVTDDRTDLFIEVLEEIDAAAADAGELEATVPEASEPDGAPGDVTATTAG